MVRIAINGYGRIGRNIVRSIYEYGHEDKFEIVAINDLAAPEVLGHLTQYDSVHGRFAEKVEVSGQQIIINDKAIDVTSIADPGQLPWEKYNVDLVLECAGKFKTHASLEPHLQAGAAKVLASYPVADADYMVVFGVNHEGLRPDHRIVSNASCTTNCLAPVAMVLDEAVGIENGYMTTIHAYTNDQSLIDKAHSDLYRARAAALSMIPTRTGAAKAVGQVLPALQGRLDGLAVRVPTANVSLVDLVFVAKRNTSVEEINEAMEAGAVKLPAGVLQYNEKPLVSIDFTHDPASSTFDAMQTRVDGKLVKIMAWYDNEWGFSNRMLDIAKIMGS